MCAPRFIDEASKQKIAAHHARHRSVSASPFGSDDEIGMLNLIDAESRRAILQRADAGTIFDLSVDHFVGMPGFFAAGDQPYQIWMTHTPGGTCNDNVTNVDRAQNELVAYSGDAISMYTHCGTHVDALNHFGYFGEIFNHFTEREHLGSRHWRVGGVDKHPPVIARGVLLDVAGLLGVDMLPDSYGIGPDDLQGCLRRQGVDLRVGDIVLVRTGRMRMWPDQQAYALDAPGITLEGARFLARSGAALIGGDTMSLEQIPTADPENWNVVHCYLLAEAGIPILEIANLEDIAEARLYEFAFFGACIRLRGATGAPIRPVVMPLTD